MNKEALERSYSNLLTDIDFDRLGLFLKQPNIFFVLGVSRYEIRHSNFLAWLLNPNESHGLGDWFLSRILRDIVIASKDSQVSIFDLPGLNLEQANISREWNNIDLLMEVGDIVIAIENKFYSSEHSDQLKRYKEIVDREFKESKKLFVYLTHLGEEASESDVYINYSYQRIVEILDDIITLYKTSLHNSTYLYIKDYIDALKILVMENSPINDLALKIYKNHKELLDFIYEMKPDAIKTNDEAIKEYIERKGYIIKSLNKGYVRFLPSQINDIIPVGWSRGWPLKEAFLFEIVTTREKKMVMKAVISPGDEEARQILKEIMSSIPGAKQPTGSLWLTYFMHYLPINMHMFNDDGQEATLKKLEAEWPKAEDFINKISKAIDVRKNDFEALISKRANLSNE